MLLKLLGITFKVCHAWHRPHDGRVPQAKTSPPARDHRTITSDFQHEATADHFSDRLLHKEDAPKRGTDAPARLTPIARGTLDHTIQGRLGCLRAWNPSHLP